MVGASAADCYNRSMGPLEIRKLIKRDPFIPVRIHVVDGSHYDIFSPADIWVDMLSIAVGVNPDDSGLFRASNYVSPSHVSRNEPLPPESSSGGNGRP